ncbi:aldose 1-epimerase [Ligilactobacillus salitolerans]|uniref:Maltose epimerase n=1 Tax=Ligilactobacillus salitolerans TaxID=1808352 RepID=A0A401ITF4_9LACO|nr:aldose epimerase family protein [Ligilactobacillus salitolerans]GBG94804.1 aldose 1-epimerase [Ligilactobacillus salitolerans]
MDIFRSVVENYEGHVVTKINLVNDNGAEISCLTMGATWNEFLVPGEDGKKHNVLLNFDQPSEYYANSLCCCQSIGRVAGRIKNGQFTLNGKQYQLPTNENGNTLHGGDGGFRFLNWGYTTSRTENSVSVIFQKHIKEERDGFPGNFLATVIYTLDNKNRVTISYSALNGEEETLFNPTCHAYFNLSDRHDLTTHSLQINSHEYLQLDDELIPTGRVLQVDDTPYDFRKFKSLQQAIDENQGFDDAFVVNGPGMATEPIVVLRDNESGRQITIKSEGTGLVMYTMPEVADGVKFSRDHGEDAIPCEGVALEAQQLPDAINNENFGDIVLKKNEKKTYHITYEFTQK